MQRKWFNQVPHFQIEGVAIYLWTGKHGRFIALSKEREESPGCNGRRTL